MLGKYNAPCALALLLSVTQASAAERLFPTDVLGPGEYDATVEAEYFTFAEFDGKTITEDLAVRAGLGKGLHVGANVSYLSRDEICRGTNCANEARGFRTSRLGARYRLAGVETDALFSLAARFGWITDALEKNSNGNNGFDAGLVAGWALDKGLRVYLNYGGAFPDKDELSDFHTLSFGAFKALTETVTLIPSLYYRHYRPTDIVESHYQYGAGCAAQVRLATNLYFLPAIGFTQFGPVDTVYSPLVGESEAWSVQMALYFFFGKGAPSSKPVAAPKAVKTIIRNDAPLTPTKQADTVHAPAGLSGMQPDSASANAPIETPAAKPAPSPLKPGMTVTLRDSAPLFARPTAGADTLLTIPSGSTVVLHSTIRNTSGNWWHSAVDDRQGWMRETDLKR